MRTLSDIMAHLWDQIVFRHKLLCGIISTDGSNRIPKKSSVVIAFFVEVSFRLTTRRATFECDRVLAS